MDMEPERDEYKNVRREKSKDDISVKELVQRCIYEQKCEDKTTSSADRLVKFPQTPNKRGVSVSNRIRQSEDTSIEDKVMG
ncbi:MAG: hypothetical protein EZS28_029884 [Streblomastix strix]|uniref:Uncharacterized protein n=1 Tax=Streblomastix strix TaxID=222440 RepID=A0A5J4UVT1_9EUKA|nr:MAG: hypothetical protein EZS28_029884 [Streblomastix strix]